MKTSKITALIPTTLMPAKVFDTQVLMLCNSLEQKHGPFPVEPTPEETPKQAIHKAVVGLSLEAAIGIMRTLGYPRDTVYLGNIKWGIADLCKSTLFPEYQGRLAREVRGLWFWGGPPRQVRWYRGSLETLVKDRVYYELNNHGVTNVAERLGL